MRQGMRDHRNLCSFGIAAVRTGVLLFANCRAGGSSYGFPVAEYMIRLGAIRVGGTASTAFFPVLCIVMLADKGVVRLFTIFSLADIADGLCLAGSGSTAVRSLVQHCIASRANMPVIRTIVGPCFGRSMTRCCNNGLLRGDFRFALCIREQLFTGGAGPVCLVAIFRAGCVLCRNSGQRVADCDLRRSNDGNNIFKIREGCTLLEKFTENRNVLLLCVTFQNFKRQCKQYAFARRYIRLFFCTSRSRSYRTTICFAVVFNRIGFNNHKHVCNIQNFMFFIANGDFIFRIDGY